MHIMKGTKALKTSSEMEIYFLDVGLGDCTLAISNGQTVLIDGGCWYVDSLKVLFREKHIKKIDYVICTHIHGDHIDGLVEILENIEVGDVFCNIDSGSDNESFMKMRRLLDARGKIIHVPLPDSSFKFGNCAVEFLGPRTEQWYMDENDRSLVCRIRCGGHSVLMMADAKASAMNDLLVSGISLRADIIKIPHHGMCDVDIDFLKCVNPKAAVISYAENRHGKLSERLLNNLGREKIEIYRTDILGDVYCQIINDEITLRRRCSIEGLRGKKLLILGANSESVRFVNRAKELGIYTIVTDHILNSPAKSIADKYYDINGKDVERLIEIVREEDIDGVLVGVADPLVPYYMELAYHLNFPCLPNYLMKDKSDFFTNKKEFKKNCSAVGIPTVKEYYSGTDLTGINIEVINYPCITKPLCGRGGKGVSLCNNKRELEEGFWLASSCSDNGEVVVEEYMDCEDVVANYFFCNGVPYLLGISDRKTLKNNQFINPVTYGNAYPSKLTEKFIEQCHSKFISLFRNLRIRNGILEMQIFWDGQYFYPYDPACILGGELSSKIFSEVLEIDLIGHFIAYALTGNMLCSKVPSNGGIIPNNKCAESIWILLKPGEISKIEGMDILKLNPNVLGFIQRLRVGDIVQKEEFGTEKSALMRIWVFADSNQEVQNLVKLIRKQIKVTDTYDRSMVWEE